MKKIFSAILTVSLLISFPIHFGAATDSIEQSFQRDRYIVFFNDRFAGEVVENAGGIVVSEYDSIHAATVEIDVTKLEDLKRNGLIKNYSSEKKVELSAQTEPWGLDSINLRAKIPSSLTGNGVKIAVIDTGVDTSHPDLNIQGGYCSLDETISSDACQNSYLDDNGHGTHVAGVIGAIDNQIGIVGVAPGAEIYAVKALDSEGNGTTSTVMAAIDWAIKNDIDIINMSLTTPSADLGIKAMVDEAYENGILVVAAAGNEGTFSGTEETVLYPAKFPTVIAVGSITRNHSRSVTSSTGNEVELAAPGEVIYSTLPSGTYGYMTGTSMAAPYVTGVVALYKEKYPDYTNQQIRALLQKNAKDLGVAGKDKQYGYGMVQVDLTPVAPTFPYTADDKGVITLNMQAILQGYESYTIYRNGELLARKVNRPTFQDYGVNGTINYTIYPVSNGTLQTDKAVTMTAGLSQPNIPDLNNSTWFTRYMMFLYSDGILKGDAYLKMNPSKSVTRAEAVAMVARANGYYGGQTSTRFIDVPASSFASGYIEAAAAAGIIKGRTNGTFLPNEPVTRAEMSIMLTRAYSLPKASPSIPFSDVNSSIAGYQEIYNLIGAKIASGYADDTFRPGEIMSRSNYAVFLARAENELLR